MFVLAMLLSLVSARGASFDPDLTWRTLRTEHFNIHFHQGEEQLAEEFSHMLEEVYDEMTDEVQWVPKRRTELVLIDRTDSANGYASVLPHNTIVIYVTAPQEDSTLSMYEDWSTAISTHELTHILHMDSHHGIVKAARKVVGRIAGVNNLSPWWMVEGYATFEETRKSAGGRGRSPLVDMIKRTSVVDDAWPPLGNLDGIQPDPPAGNLRYLYGQDFMQFISDQTGEDIWTVWVHTYGSRLPYLLPGKKVFGRRIRDLYEHWRLDVTERYTRQMDEIRAQGIREGRLVSVDTMSCGAPRFAPDGEKLVWSCYDMKTGSALWMSDGWGYGGEILLQDFGAKNFTWRSDSEAFVYASTHIVNRFNTWSDIYLLNLGSTYPIPLTSGARARDPDFHPDGTHVAMVTNRAQDNQLAVIRVDQRLEHLTENTDHTQYATPRYSPDGKVLAVSVWAAGRRDLWLFDADGKPVRQLTADAPNDRDPDWSLDGKWLFFASYRTGVPNIFAIDTETERLWQVTNVLTGAVKPSINPDNTLLAYQQYTNNGWEVRVMDVDPDTWIDRGLLPAAPQGGPSIRSLTQPVPLPELELYEQDDAEPEETASRPVRKPSRQARRRALTPGGYAGVDLKDGRPVPGALPPDLGQVAPYGYEWWQQPTPSDSIQTFGDTSVEDVFGEEQDYPFTIEPRRYNPLRTLRPTYVYPYVLSTTELPSETFASTCIEGFYCRGLQANLVTGGRDTLQRYAWGARANYRTDADYLGWGASFTVNRWLPVYTLSAGSSAGPLGYLYRWNVDQPAQADGSPNVYNAGRYWEKRLSTAFTVSYPYTQRTWVFGQYALTQRGSLFELPSDTYLPLVPLRGYEGSISGGWRYSWSQQTAHSISTEDGRIFSLVGRVLSPWLGTWVRDDNDQLQPLSQLQLTSEVREYRVNPFIPNHVLAVRAAGGITFGATDFLGNYQLGGSFGDGAFYVAPDSSVMVRGYPFAHDIGDLYWVTGAEYRLPLWRIDRGMGVNPLYARVLSGAVFLDAGNAFTSLQAGDEIFGESLVGTGAEVRLSSAILWSIFLTGRLGYAVGLTENGYGPTDPGTVYFRFGGSF